jgi:5-enolpyruvylshikimate-3-phosphate synthase
VKVVIGLVSEKELPGEGIRRQNEGWGGCKIRHESEHDVPSKRNDLGGAGTVNRALTALHLALTSNSVIRHQHSHMT